MATVVFRDLITNDGFCDFLTLQSYQSLITNNTMSGTPLQMASLRRASAPDAGTALGDTTGSDRFKTGTND